MTLRPFIIDCDTGRDDALAIWTALSMEAPLKAVVTSYGNTTLENVTENTARVLGMFNGDRIPLWACSSIPSKEHKGYHSVVLPRQDVSGNGICNIELPAAERQTPHAMTCNSLADHIKALADEYGPLDYIILGPATNLAAAIQSMGDDVLKYISRITMMGGTLDHMWDELKQPDFNIICDPFAIQTLFDSCIEMRFVSLSTTWPIELSLDQLEALSEHGDHELSEISKEIMVTHTREFAPEPIFRFHDPAVIVAAQQDEEFEDVKLSIITDEDHKDFGRLVYDDKGHKVGLHKANSSIRERILTTILDGLGLEQEETPSLRNAG